MIGQPVLPGPAALPHAVHGSRGVVASGHQAATEAGLDMLRRGGNAFDAAIAVILALGIALPTSAGLGGDLVVAVREPGQAPRVIIAVGHAPSRGTAEGYAARGLPDIPLSGVLSATVPAVADGLFALARSGRLSPRAAAAPALRLAEDGIVVGDQLSRWVMAHLDKLVDPSLRARFGADGDGLHPGDVLRQPQELESLELFASAPSAHAFRVGVFERFARAGGAAAFDADDFTNGQAEDTRLWPVDVGPVTLYTAPPPTQGPVTHLAALALGHLVRDRPVDSLADLMDRQIAATHLAFGWATAAKREGLCHASPIRLASVAEELSRAADRPGPSLQHRRVLEGDTTSFSVSDAEGNALAGTVSLSLAFGAGVPTVGDGMILNNRLGRSTALTELPTGIPDRPWRPVNTLQAFCADACDRRVAGATPGGDGQVQWILQACSAVAHTASDWVRTVGSPRWHLLPGPDLIDRHRKPTLRLDSSWGPDVADDLRSMGHPVTIVRDAGGALRLAWTDGPGPVAISDGRQEGTVQSA